MSSCRTLVAVAASIAASAPLVAAELPVAETSSAVSMAYSPMGQQGAVDCGGHYAENCGVCPGKNGAMWCNGECLWLDNIWVHDECREDTLWNRLIYFDSMLVWTWFHTIPFTFLIALAMTAYAVVYKRKIVNNLPQEMIPPVDPDFDDYKPREVTLFDCFKVQPQCLWAAFCTPVVAGKNYHTGGVAPFWPSCVLVFIGMFSFFWPVYCAMALVRTKFSSDLQRNLHHEPNFFMDFLTTLFCFPCEVGRESMEVDDKLDVELKCPFEMEKGLRARGELAVEAIERNCTRACS